MVVPAVAAGAVAAPTGLAIGGNILRQLAFQAGLTGLSAAVMDPNAGKKLGKVGGFLQDAGGNLARDLLDTQPRFGRQNSAPKTTDRPYGSTATLNGKPVVWAGKDYGWQSPITGSSTLNSLNSPGVQNRFIQDTGSSSSPAAERAYQAERSSTAQQAKQNPGLPISYSDQAELARQALQGYDPASGPLPGAAQTAQDMGMAIWAKKYGPGSKNDLASKVRPGQSGFGAIQNTLAASAANTGFQLPTQLSFTPPPSVTPTPFPMAALQSGFQVPGALTMADQLSTYPEFDPKKVDIGLFSKFMQANPKK
jgi:hypothetical protein